jgi:hypothetical protein
VSASEIIPQVKKYFPEADIRPFGGGILQYALDENFYDNFDSQNPIHTKCFELLCFIERHYMNTGEIGINQAFIIANK